MGIVLPSNPIVLYSRLIVDPMHLSSRSKNGEMSMSWCLTTSGTNENFQTFMDEDLRDPEVYQSPIGEPIDNDHEQTFQAVVGEIRDSKYVKATAHRPSAIISYGVIFEDLYPEVAMKVRRGAGRWAGTSMEALPNPLERVGKYLVIHKPKFVGCGLVRFKGNKYSDVESIDGEPVEQQGVFDADVIQQAVIRLGYLR
jgi:hypothetical protein